MFGVEITIIGMVLLFLSMTLFIILAEALKRVFRPKNESETSVKPQREQATAMVEEVSDEEVAAAIAAVVATHTRKQSQSKTQKEEIA